MSIIKRIGATAVVIGLTVAGGCADTGADPGYSEDEQEELNQLRQDFVDTTNGLKVVNGLKVINGLTTVNGLKVINGLTTTNGLKVINGLKVMNGLKTANGLKVINGLQVDCTGKTLGTTCTGAPDGILKSTTGMMSTDGGINTAKYMVRCALPATNSIRVKDYTGALVTLTGEIGLAPEWADGDCNVACEEKVSACLMALTNGAGTNVRIELTSPLTQIGTNRSATAYYQEAAFYGNLFLDDAKAYIAAGYNYGSLVMNRSCGGYSWNGDGCPYKFSGSMTAEAYALAPGSINKCTQTAIDNTYAGNRGVATKCSAPGTTTQAWLYPITTYRFEAP